jgi:DNA-binding CsgD family transcriptional regulator
VFDGSGNGEAVAAATASPARLGRGTNDPRRTPDAGACRGTGRGTRNAFSLIDAIRTVAAGGSCSIRPAPRVCWERIRTGRAREPDQLASLTPRERRILEFVAEGLTNRQIGAEMFLAEKTVKDDVSSLLAKLGPSVGPRRRSSQTSFSISSEAGPPAQPGTSATCRSMLLPGPPVTCRLARDA